MTTTTHTTDERLDVDYCRISDDKNHAGEGVDSQHAENEEFAAEQGRAITRTYVDNDISAFGTSERPDYDRLRGEIADGLVGSVTFWHANRLHRDVEQAIAFLRLARQHRVRLFSVSKGAEYNLNRTAGRQDFINDTLKAQGESEERGDRVALARKRQARTGAYGGGVRNYGWGVDTGRVRSVCVNPKAPPMERVYADRAVLDMAQHNPDEAAEIRQWAEDVLAGVSMAQIIRDLTRRGVATVAMTDGRQVKRNGKEATHRGWNARTIKQVLTSPRTSGHSVYRGEIVQRNAFDAIIAEDQRQALITLFSDPKRKTSPGNTPKWLGSLIYRCGFCNDGSVMSVRRNSRGEPVYRCHFKAHCTWPAQRLDDWIEKSIIARLSRSDLADLIPGKKDVDVNALRDQLVVLDSRKRDAAQRFAAGSIDGDMMETITATVDTQISEIRAELSSATAQSPLTDFVGNPNVQSTWDGLSLGRKREILRVLPFTVTLTPIGRGKGRTFNPDLIKIDSED